jgi:molybdenum cofactor biosynthesis protein B
VQARSFSICGDTLPTVTLLGAMANPRSESSTDHQEQARKLANQQPVRCAVLTVSDTRTPHNDAGGPLIEQHLARGGHQCVARSIVPDEPAAIDGQLRIWLNDPTIHAILITGGTGVSQRDTTIEVVRRLIRVELEGFGELFRMLSYQQVKGAAMLSRAVGGLALRSAPVAGGAGPAHGTFIFAMPGSPNAVETAMANLIAPQLAHLVWERKR